MQPEIPSNEQLREAIRKQWAGQALHAREQALFDEWLAASPHNRAMWDAMRDEASLEALFAEWNRYAGQRVWDKFSQLRHGPAQPARKVRTLYRWAAAAAILMGIAIGAYLLTSRQSQPPAVAEAPADVAPGGQRAVLVLADGSQVTLDSAGNQVIHQGSVAIRQQAGQLRYDGGDDASSIQYNTLKTPRGGQFRITLPDGTNVWLNAESTLRFPTAFRGKERLVEMTGEVYFEVKTDAARPFRVTAPNGTAVEVLGTHFNINAYADEPAVRTTLLTGAVKVRKNALGAVLKPGQQAEVSSRIKVVNDVDIDKVMAWKNGVFDFNDAKLKDVMQQLSRWYDIEVEYRGNVPEAEFWGKMGRNLTLMEVLSGLEGTGIHFKLEDNGKKLVVLP